MISGTSIARIADELEGPLFNYYRTYKKLDKANKGIGFYLDNDGDGEKDTLTSQIMETVIKKESSFYDECFADELEKIAVAPAAIYDRPLSKEQIKNKSKSLYEKLMNCPIHEFRARTGIELIHREPNFSEQMRIWDNWNLMTEKAKRISDAKSIELFGISNKENHELILKKYYKI